MYPTFPVTIFLLCFNSGPILPQKGISPKFQTSQSTFPFEVFLQFFPMVALLYCSLVPLLIVREVLVFSAPG